MKKYDLIFSLGEACSCTSVIRSCGLQNFSYPFDWLYGNSFEGRIDILASDFNNFINKEDLLFCFSSPEIKKDAYKNTRTEIVFNHDFTYEIPLDESYNEVKEKYDRRINRLLDSIKNAKKILLVFVEAPNNESSLKDNNILINAQEKLSKSFKNQNIDILYTVCDKNIPLGETRTDKINKHIIKYNFNYKHQNPDMPIYAVDNNILKNIFNGYSLKDNEKKHQSLRHNILRVIACFIPNKKLRKRIRGNKNG